MSPVQRLPTDPAAGPDQPASPWPDHQSTGLGHLHRRGERRSRPPIPPPRTASPETAERSTVTSTRIPITSGARGMSDLRIAVLGLGMMGAFHVDLLTSSIKGATVTVVNDFVPAKAEEVAARIGARVVADPIAAINDPEVDAVLLATPGQHPLRAGVRLPGRRQAGAVREAAHDRRRDVVRAGAEGGGPGADPGAGGLHAPLRRRVRRAQEPDRLRWSRPSPAAALHPPQPGRAGPLQLRVHDQGLGRARGRRHPLPVGQRDHQRPGAGRRGDRRGTRGHPRPDAGGLRDRRRSAGHRRDLRPLAGSRTRCGPRPWASGGAP